MATTSYVAIANLALIQLGCDTIMSLDEATEQARKVNAIYEFVRDEVLRSYPWNFAISWAKLSALSETPTNGYTYAYQLPTSPKCLRVITLNNGIEDFRVEGGKLYTNEPTATIQYISQVTDPTLFDSSFISCYATRLAAELAYPLKGDKELAKLKWNEYYEKLREARSVDSQEGKPQIIDRSYWLEERFSSENEI